jgi:hypothetical protein
MADLSIAEREQLLSQHYIDDRNNALKVRMEIWINQYQML